ncbi:MAG: circularly permuted type 2 ATP-grasp protein, partial [Pseudomonadota bacterium]|nr:circularly permuted type 2 ATP-grasp protein [Pseudomonadota bacterium]
MVNPEPLPVGTRSSLTGAYPCNSAIYDEMCLAGGVLRLHWRELVAALEAIGPDELGRRRDEAQRLLQENGVTYNVYDDARSAQRPWVVDPVPLLVSAEEWGRVEAGLAQRSRLLDLLLRDLYGPRTVIRRGLLPPELVYAHPGFLRPCHHSLPDKAPWLVFHGVDLGRSPDGRFWALGDRVQAPAGVGYALENRIILSRALPDLYRDAPLRRLAGFLEAKRRTLMALAPHNRDQPRVVLLTPGPANEAYFEHAYIANYLSLSLVEGEDLAVRDGRVWLKTLGGLKPVDVILRHVNGDFCDPLELRPESLLGTPGLLQALRSGNVAVANAPGCGIVETPALLAFLPGLCRRLLGEELRLPSIATWWCGGAKELDYVIHNLDRLVIRPVLPGQPSCRGETLDREGRVEMIRRLKAAPHLFVGQESVALSTAPVLDGSRLQPRPVALRAFTVADDGGYRVMPGALVRVAANGANPFLAGARSGIGKDLWVLAAAPERHVSLLRQAHGPVAVTRDGADLPSRVADNLYWLGRYGERLDGTTRLLRETLVRMVEQDRSDSEDSCVDDLLDVLGLDLEEEDDPAPHSRFLAARGQLLALLTDIHHTGSLPGMFAGMLRTGKAVRDHLGDDSWRVLNRLQRRVQSGPAGLSTNAARDLLEGNLTLLAAFFGLCNETMPHHLGWVFMDIGRHLERVLNTLGLLRLAFVTARRPGVPLWEVVLITTDNFTAYRRRYRSELHPAAILDLLLFDEDNPRSVGYQVRRLNTQIGRLPRPRISPYRSAEERLVLEALSRLQ